MLQESVRCYKRAIQRTEEAAVGPSEGVEGLNSRERGPFDVGVIRLASHTQVDDSRIKFL